VAKSFSLSLSLSLGGSNLFFEGKNASGKDFNVSKRHMRHVYDKKEGGGQPKISGEENTRSGKIGHQILK